MPDKSIALGGALIILGIVAKIASGTESFTALIPSFIGVVFVILGLVARLKPALSHHMMHGAAALALIGILGSLPRLITASGWGWAPLSQIVTVILCAVFLAFAVMSFRAARLARTGEAS